MKQKITIFNTLYTTYEAMGLPVSGITEDMDFTINDLKELHPVLPFKFVGYRPSYFSFLCVKDARGQYTTDAVSFQTEPYTDGIK